jgi:hypothetical protein
MILVMTSTYSALDKPSQKRFIFVGGNDKDGWNVGIVVVYADLVGIVLGYQDGLSVDLLVGFSVIIFSVGL